MKGKVITPTGSEQDIELPNFATAGESDSDSTTQKFLDAAQKIVGGWIEFVRTKDDKTMIVNEEGRLIGLTYNPKASAMYGDGKTGLIVGTVILLDIKKEDIP